MFFHRKTPQADNTAPPRMWHSAYALPTLVLGQRCAACLAPCMRSPVCPACTQLATAQVPRCPRCAVPQGSGALCGACIRKPPAFDETLCVGSFKDPLADLIAQFKFGNRLTLAAWFAARLDKTLNAHPCDVIVPIPLFSARLSERGFNQAWEICKLLKHPAPKKHAMTRLRDTPSQRSVTASERFSNVRNAFIADASVQGLRLVLIDDVVTTTATVEAASKALKKAGASHITVACIARVSD